MTGETRVRFAPSPTGPLHIGGARSALFNYLFAGNNNGKFILRIEDTDRDRSKAEYEEGIKEALKWLGIAWHEGIDAGGDYAPYRQMDRLETYKKYAKRLLDKGLAYRCYCTEGELEEERNKQVERGETPRYNSRCCNLTPEEEAEVKDSGRSPVIRFKVPRGRSVIINDLVRDKVSFDTDGIGDFIIMKSGGIPTYNFAVVLDDYEMRITHIRRGEEHLTNTAPQVLLYEALDLHMPEFAHVSLILGKDRSKMSKRHGETSVDQYRSNGFLPEALVNFLALLGWSPEGEEEIFTLDELKESFSLDRVSKSPAVFDIEKLRWINGCYIRESSSERIAELALPFLRDAGYRCDDREWLLSVVSVLKNYLTTVSDITEHMELFVNNLIVVESEEALEDLRGEHVPVVLDKLLEGLDALFELNEEGAKKVIKGIPKDLGLKPKEVFMPLRIALTGKKKGPELHQIIPVLGIENVKERIYYIKETYFK